MKKKVEQIEKEKKKEVMKKSPKAQEKEKRERDFFSLILFLSLYIWFLSRCMKKKKRKKV